MGKKADDEEGRHDAQRRHDEEAHGQPARHVTPPARHEPPRRHSGRGGFCSLLRLPVQHGLNKRGFCRRVLRAAFGVLLAQCDLERLIVPRKFRAGPQRVPKLQRFGPDRATMLECARGGFRASPLPKMWCRNDLRARIIVAQRCQRLDKRGAVFQPGNPGKDIGNRLCLDAADRRAAEMLNSEQGGNRGPALIRCFFLPVRSGQSGVGSCSRTCVCASPKTPNRLSTPLSEGSTCFLSPCAKRSVTELDNGRSNSCLLHRHRLRQVAGLVYLAARSEAM